MALSLAQRITRRYLVGPDVYHVWPRRFHLHKILLGITHAAPTPSRSRCQGMASLRGGRRAARTWVRTLNHRLTCPRLDGGVLPWLDSLVQHLKQDLCEPNGPSPISNDVLLPPRIEAHVVQAATQPADKQGCVRCDAPSPPTDPATKPFSSARLDDSTMYATVVKNDRMTDKSHFQDVRCIELALPSNTPVPAYHAGDVVCVRPENKAADVDWLLGRLGWSSFADDALTLTRHDPRTYTRASPWSLTPPD